MSLVEYREFLGRSGGSDESGPRPSAETRLRCLPDKPESTHHLHLEALLGRSSGMKHVLSQVRRVAPTSATVLITGESGTGKEITATAIHEQSDRRGQPFVPVNCGAISPQLIESELFGHDKGSFTGAVRSHRGVFEQADGGTLFLDELTEMPLELQVKLLRVLETRRFVRVGSDHERDTDVRIIAATNRCPEDEVASGKLRADLLYRLQVFPIELPSLRERRDDIRDLALHFLQELNQADGAHKAFSEDALVNLENYAWPRNIRELKNVVQRGYIMADHRITVKELPSEIARPTAHRVRQNGQTLTVDIGTSVAEMERNLIIATLDQCGGRKERAANILGVSMKTLYNRLRKYEEQESGQPTRE
ncbi:regulatory protein, Fis family [Marinobacter daqiaonensis]|uniref:Regulatory protein, Fis family n=1 Tax=Marinobacter daqiaonensis TaxID=650891 RepID=A0A1I6GNZ3_9GAMM|nr:sigma-54 dependent transcriptional regulator [Marinobacter daqiaonensis]SFR43910.1 regulatory protein, Fis family [Marinobacter daqiaonensis]